MKAAWSISCRHHSARLELFLCACVLVFMRGERHASLWHGVYLGTYFVFVYQRRYRRVSRPNCVDRKTKLGAAVGDVSLATGTLGGPFVLYQHACRARRRVRIFTLSDCLHSPVYYVLKHVGDLLCRN